MLFIQYALNIEKYWRF